MCTVIPRLVLVVAKRFSPSLSAARVAASIARGLHTGAPAYEVERRALADGEDRFEDSRQRPAYALELDARALGGVRALVLADHELCDGAPPSGAMFEIATRARQGGIPAYAVTGAHHPDLFQARMLDLQVVLPARGERALVRAGVALGRVI
jgi:hypothetical protein